MAASDNRFVSFGGNVRSIGEWNFEGGGSVQILVVGDVPTTLAIEYAEELLAHKKMELAKIDRAAERAQRDRPATNPGGMVCDECSEVFIGEERHALCAICEARRTDGEQVREEKS